MKLPTTKKRLTIKKPGIRIRSFAFLVTLALLLSAGLLGASGYVWYKKILTDSDRVFYGMLERSLSTDSVTRTVSQEAQLRNVTQTYQINYVPSPLVESQTTIEQIGQDRQKSVVQTRAIGLEDTDYLQYSGIDIPSLTSQNNVNDILGKWAKRTANPETGESPQLLSEALFMFVPFGNLEESDRDELIELAKKNRTYRIGNSKLVMSGSRPVMTYNVAINPQSLVEVLALYVEKTGIGDSAQLNPDDYKGAGNIEVTLTIDVLTRHLKELAFSADSRKETYAGYGLLTRPVLPTETITIQELQTRLQTLQ